MGEGKQTTASLPGLCGKSGASIIKLRQTWVHPHFLGQIDRFLLLKIYFSILKPSLNILIVKSFYGSQAAESQQRSWEGKVVKVLTPARGGPAKPAGGFRMFNRF